MAGGNPRWRIFYYDHSEFGHEDGEIWEAPWYGVIAIVQDCYKPCQVIHQCNFYWWRPDWNRWNGGDVFGALQDSARYGATWIKEGETIKPEDNREIMAKAIECKEKWDKG